MCGGGAVAVSGRPGPFADIHGPPDADKFESFDPAKILFGRVIEGIHGAISGEFETRVSNHD